MVKFAGKGPTDTFQTTFGGLNASIGTERSDAVGFGGDPRFWACWTCKMTLEIRRCGKAIFRQRFPKLFERSSFCPPPVVNVDDEEMTPGWGTTLIMGGGWGVFKTNMENVV